MNNIKVNKKSNLISQKKHNFTFIIFLLLTSISVIITVYQPFHVLQAILEKNPGNDLMIKLKQVNFSIGILLIIFSAMLIVLIKLSIDLKHKKNIYEALQDNYTSLNEKYNILLGSKRIVDAELQYLKDKLRELEKLN